MLTLTMKRKPTTPEVKAFLAALRRFVKRHPSQKAASAASGIPMATLESWLKKRRVPSPLAIRAYGDKLKP